jgi:GH24 family phage-related lysozyme (muramidase)
MATYLELSLWKIKEFEGCIPWMYRDTAGKITVGVGLMLPDAEAAAALPFQIGGVVASQDVIRTEYERVKGLPEGKAAIFYRRSSSPVLAQAAIDANLQEALEGFEGKLREVLKGYDSYPVGAKLALLDMAYNLGPAGLLHGYPRLIAAVEEGRWTDAAADCERHGPSAERNEWTRDQFLGRVTGAIRAEAETGLKRLWRMLRGF